MLYYLSPSNDPYYNLALEEYLLKHTKEEILLCYINRPCIVLGRFQVPFKELDVEKLSLYDMQVVRRLSGGGTVYHDEGNLNYSFISDCVDSKSDYYGTFNAVTTKILEKLSLKNISYERNNIFCSGKKVSGVAQYKRGKRIVHHGTLLVDADLVKLRAVFTTKDYYTSKGVASVSSSVSNINEFVPLDMEKTLSAFEASCNDRFVDFGGEANIQEMATYYATKEWLYGKAPNYSLQHNGIELSIVKGRITSISESSLQHLTGVWHSYDVLAALHPSPQILF